MITEWVPSREHKWVPFGERPRLGRFAQQPVSPKLLGAAREVYGPTFHEEELLRRSASYGAWGGHWALYLWASGFEGL